MRLVLTAGLIAVCCFGPVEAADIGWAVDTGHDGNLNRAGPGHPEKSDTWLAATWDLRGRRQQDVALAWVYGARARGEVWAEYDGLNHLDLSGRVGLRYKPGIGRDVLSYGLDLSLGATRVSDSARDDAYLEVAATLRRPMGISAEVYGGYRYRNAEAEHRVFDTERHAVHAGWSRSVSDDDALRVEAELRDGDIISVTPLDPAVFAVSRAAAFDEVFGTGWAAYRLDGVTQLLRVRWERALDRGAVLGLGLEAFHARADQGPDYDGLRLSLDYRFGRR